MNNKYAIILSFLIIMFAFFSLSFAEETGPGYGDLTASGSFSEEDVTELKNIMLEVESYNELGDANRDGIIDLEDIAWLRKCNGEMTIYLDADFPANSNIPLVLVRIPAGNFTMGSPAGERNRDGNEGPLTEVTLTQDYYMGKYPLTQQQWLAIRGSWPGSAPSEDQGLGDDYPAYNINWNDVQGFINDLNIHIENTQQGPLTVSAPTDAQWEYAARAGTTTRFYFGDSLSETDDDIDGPTDSSVYTGNRTDYGWFSINSDESTHEVGQKPPNAFGLYDMHGNVWEWIYGYGTYPGGHVTDPIGAGTDVARGGGRTSVPRNSRSARRWNPGSTNRSGGLGFRISAVISE